MFERTANESIDGVYLFICCCVPTCEVDCKEMKILCGKKNWAVVCNVNLFIFRDNFRISKTYLFSG